jgi:hypothetical protein
VTLTIELHYHAQINAGWVKLHDRIETSKWHELYTTDLSGMRIGGACNCVINSDYMKKIDKGGGGSVVIRAVVKKEWK